MSHNERIAEFMDRLSPAERTGLDRLRAITMAASPDLREEIKWNAPSYTHHGQDRVTLGLERKGGFRVVLHCGAKSHVAEGERMNDEFGLARWPSHDRGVVQFRNEGEIELASPKLQRLISDWVRFNGPA